MSTLTIPGFQSKRFKPLQTLYTNTITPLVFFFFWESTLLVILTARGIITSPCLILCRFNWAKSDQAQTFWHFGSWDLRFLCAGLLAMPDSTWGWLRSRSPATATPPIDASLPVYRNHKNWQLAAGSFQIKRKNEEEEKHVSVISQLAALNGQKLWGASLSVGAQGQGLHLFFLQFTCIGCWLLLVHDSSLYTWRRTYSWISSRDKYFGLIGSFWFLLDKDFY
jgi:hypothetical protein